MSFLDDLARRKIEEAIQSGEWKNVPGKGQPLNLDEDLSVPEHMRLGHKLLRDAGVLPEWMEIGRGVEKLRRHCHELLPRLEREGNARRRKWQDERDDLKRQKYFESYTTWREGARDDYKRALSRVNSEILRLNLKAPRSARPQIPFRIDEELQRFDERVPQS